MAGEPAWSPARQRRQVCKEGAESLDGSQYLEGIGTISRDGGEITPVFFSPPDIVCCATPRIWTWSPDGNSILFSSGHHLPPDPEWPHGKFEPGVEFYLIPAETTSGPARVTYDYSMNMEANWWAPNTSAGHDVAVVKGDATIIFHNVIATGSTRMTVTEYAPGPAPEGFEFVSECWEGATTAQTHGDCAVAIHYDETGLSPRAEGRLALMQWAGDRWVDITQPPVDRAGNVIRGLCSTLSVFAVVAASGPREPPMP